jgi:cell division protein FtsB
MANRLIPLMLIGLLVVLHAQLWQGRGSISNVKQMQSRLDAQKAKNARSQLANEQLASEVSDLQEGLGMVEEKAREELGMVKPNEIFVQISK